MRDLTNTLLGRANYREVEKMISIKILRIVVILPPKRRKLSLKELIGAWK